MPDQSSVSVNPIVGHDRVCTVLAGVLRGAALSWTDEALQAVSGVHARTIKSYRTEGKEPSLSNALSLLSVLGKAGVPPILALIGWSGSPLDEGDQLDLGNLVASGLHDLSTIALAAADGRIDHIEQPMCQAAADHIIATFRPLSSAAGAA